MEALAFAIFCSWGWNWSQTFLAQSFTLLSLSSLQPDSVSTSTAPPDSAAASFLFTGLVPSKALGPGTYTPSALHPGAGRPMDGLLQPFAPREMREIQLTHTAPEHGNT